MNRIFLWEMPALSLNWREYRVKVMLLFCASYQKNVEVRKVMHYHCLPTGAGVGTVFRFSEKLSTIGKLDENPDRVYVYSAVQGWKSDATRFGGSQAGDCRISYSFPVTFLRHVEEVF